MITPKRVIIVTQYFYPENFRINELAYELVKDGYEVDALVGIPNYPKGFFFDGYGVFKKRHEVKNGVHIYRCYQIPRGTRGSKVQLSLNYLSFVLCASFWILFKFSFKKKYDAIIAFEPSPITLILPAILLGKIRKTKVLSWIQDIWPDSMVTEDKSSLYSKLLWKPLSSITEFVYRNSYKILISSPGMKEFVNRNFDYSQKIEYVPNWSDDFQEPGTIPNPLMPEGFNIVMAGTINEGVGIDDIIKLIEELKDIKDINFVFIGGGSKKDYLEEYVKSHNLTNTYILGIFPYEQMPTFYMRADAMLLSLAKTDLAYLGVTIPSRLQSYLSAGKPVFAMIGSGARDVICNSKCGFVVDSGDYVSLAEIIKQNYKNNGLLKQMGENSRRAYDRYFTIQVGTKHFENLIDS